MQAFEHFPPSRNAALARLQDFLPRAGRDYAARRNCDLDAGRQDGVSMLSPYIRHRLLTEEEVLTATLGRYALSTAEKFVQEVFWRTCWKGWLAMRPGVLDRYLHDLRAALDAVQTQAGLRAETGLSPLHIAPHLPAFLDQAISETADRYVLAAELQASEAASIARWARERGLQQLVAAYAPVGPVATLLDRIAAETGLPVVRVRRAYDSAAWPHATHGFFRFKDRIPELVADPNGLRAA